MGRSRQAFVAPGASHGRAQKAFKGLPAEAKANYAACKGSLKERFEPAVNNHWTGLLDWNTGLDWTTGLLI